MTWAELARMLKKKNCKFNQHLTNHDEWINQNTGKKFKMGRHAKEEVPSGTLHSILKDAGLK